MEKTTVLFLCTHNVARSQMAEAFLKRLGGDCFEVYSAGLTPGEAVHPAAVQVMEELGYDIADQYPKSLRQYFANLDADFVIFVCERAEEDCPFLWPLAITGLSWPFEDPACCDDYPDLTLERFRRVRDQIQQSIERWLRGRPECRRAKRVFAAEKSPATVPWDRAGVTRLDRKSSRSR